jgi:DNA repair protein RecO
MHNIHHTEAFVLGSSPKGEDSRLLKLYTRELGLVYAHAQGLRKLSSKLRFTLQDFSRATVDLVRGKEIWRVTTAAPMHTYASVRQNPAAERILSRANSLLVRLVTGEEPSEEIFAILSETYDLLEKEVGTPESYRALELFTIARILIALGYLSRDTFRESAFDEGVPEALGDAAYQHRLIRDINQALAATQL